MAKGRMLTARQEDRGDGRRQRGPHLIVMGEPTNHMDLPSILCLEQAFADCPCAMLLVSHDETFLEKITATDWHLTRDDAGDTSFHIQR